ncbi:N-acetylmuramoyl-L-alanine amidase [Chlamydia trachomatis]|nr:N-acetylmuramoyl-L-alanine amidase [Chlamydia trachomatis]
MTYTNSKLVSYTKLSPNHSGHRTHSIDRITPHCVVGQCSVETLGNIFAPTSRQTSCNYGIGPDGRVGMYVEEKNRSWCSSSNANDQRAVTIECASDTKHPYTMNSTVYATLIKLCVDICKRNGKKKLIWLGDKNKTLNYSPKSDEMVLTVHRWFANKSCPGDWLYARLGDLAAKVTAELSGTTSGSGSTAPTTQMYRVRKSWSDAKSQIGAYKVLDNAKKKVDENSGYKVFDVSGNVVYPAASTPAPTPSKDTSYKVQVSIANLNIRKGPGTNYDRTGQFTGKGIFTIVQESKGAGATLWGKLKSGVGWISLDFAKKL